MSEEQQISKYWQTKGKTLADKTEGRVFQRSNGIYMCNECCNGDRCDDPSHQYRPECRACLGTAYNRTADELNAMARNNSQHLQL